jgi:hypothetical protein
MDILDRIKLDKMLQVRNDPEIKKVDYADKDEFRYNKKTMLIPKKNNKLNCLMLTENGQFIPILRRFSQREDHFIFNGGMYIIDREAMYSSKNGNRYLIYHEGISIPLKSSHIEKYEEEVEYKDLFGQPKKTRVQKIRGLILDSKLLAIFLNRKFAEVFTKQTLDNFQIFILIIGIITMALCGINAGLIYYFR